MSLRIITDHGIKGLGYVEVRRTKGGNTAVTYYSAPVPERVQPPYREAVYITGRVPDERVLEHPAAARAVTYWRGQNIVGQFRQAREEGLVTLEEATGLRRQLDAEFGPGWVYKSPRGQMYAGAWLARTINERRA